MAEQKRQPVEYRVKEKSYIGNEMVEAGATVFYDGLPSDNLEPLDAEGRARAEEFKRSDKERADKLIADNKPDVTADSEKFAAAFAKELAAQKADSDAKYAENQATITKLLQALTQSVPAVVHTDAPAEQPKAVEQPKAQPAAEGQAATDDSTEDVKTDGTTTGAKAARAKSHG